MGYILCMCIFRLILPALIAVCTVFRPCGLSAIYFCFMVALPFVPTPTAKTMKGHTGRYFIVMIGISSITLLCTITFQVVLLAIRPYAHFLVDCQFLEKLLRHVGFVSLKDAPIITVITWVSPEILMFFISIGLYIACQKLTFKDADAEMARKLLKKKDTRKFKALVISIGRYGVLCSMCLAAVLRPSVQGGLYFIVFLSSATWWACYKQLRKGFAILLRCLMIVVVLHMFTLFAYQLQWVQEFVARDAFYARILGLIPIFTVNCSDPRNFLWANEEWATYANPVALYLFYYIMALESTALMKPQVQKKQGNFSRLENSFSGGTLNRQISTRLSNKGLVPPSAAPSHRWRNATRKVRITEEKPSTTERSPLLRGVSPARRYGSSKKSSIVQDSTGSVIVGENPDDIPLEQMNQNDEYAPTLFETVTFVFESLLQVIIKASYIGTNIIMMTWSITYLSWITFVLLLWANLIWLIPNQRKSMLRSSPFLVVYAWFLLLSAYAYCMDLTESELPSNVSGINLAQVGFQKYPVLPCNSLMVKCLYTAMFWITLRQYMQERLAEKQSHALADMVAPLQVTVGTAAGIKKEQETGPKIMEKIGFYVKRFLTTFWIWVVALTLFGVAITGNRMTLFRILYMALFLFFVLSFQLSFRVWRKIMFAFWLVVIILSMIMLVLVYTYQFDHFKEYWEKIGVPVQQQLDIGLQQYETKQLFIRLATPTFFVIITVIQLHYFHSDFMTLSDPKHVSQSRSTLAASNVTNVISEDATSPISIFRNQSNDESDLRTLTPRIGLSSKSLEKSNKLSRSRWPSIIKLTSDLIDYGFLFFELHMPKIILLFAMLQACHDECAIYICTVVLLVLALSIGKSIQNLAIYSTSIFASILLLSRMVYQIEFFVHRNYNVTCQNDTGNSTKTVTQNGAAWFGFLKVSDDFPLSEFVKWNIYYIFVVTLWAVILVRQRNYRISKGLSLVPPNVMFPLINRVAADKNLINFVKYMFNFAFYKFGLEISLMTTVALIGIRNDIFSLMYSIWLLLLCLCCRQTAAKIWPFYLFFIAIFLPIQYFMVIGFPPSFCMVYPWDSDNIILRNVQEWAFLIDQYNPPPAPKLICDFVLLLVVSCQKRVFAAEKKYGPLYDGGSNDVIIEYAEVKGFVNPVPDFITYVRTYLDVVKNAFLQGMLWLTLAIVFLAGTNRVNVFSIGYLLGAFVFLWHGTDLYLRPIPKIIRSWNYLLGYNVIVILIKVMLQIVGCIFLQEIQNNSCWLVQILGIGCVRKFGTSLDTSLAPTDDECVVPRDFIGLVWDGLCFGFLISQRRIFHSYNFFHMIDDAKASSILASRGAELIEELLQKRMKEQEETEHKVLEKIKSKMDRIKATQQKILGMNYRDSLADTNHHFGRSESVRRRRKSAKTYKDAVRSGDYYMFDDLEDEEVDLEQVDSVLSFEADAEESKVKRRGVTELLSTALKTDIGTTLRRYSDPDLKKGSPSQISTPYSAPPVISQQNIPRAIYIGTEDEPVAGPSKEEFISAEEPAPEDSEDKQQESFWKKLKNFFLFSIAFIDSCLTSFTNVLNRYSRDYRYVVRMLNKERKILKEATNYNIGRRSGANELWEPAGSYHTLIKQADTYSKINLYEEYESEMSSYEQPSPFRLVLAVWHIILSRSELLCYFAIFINQIKSATFLSLPLPLMVFAWGTLTVPRPTKTFWVTIIAYTEVIVLIKSMFQYEIIPWNRKTDIITDPFFAPRIIGIERRNYYAVWDLLLLLVVFFHRYMLKSMGLWKTSAMGPEILEAGVYKIGDEGQLEPLDRRQKTMEFHSSSSNSLQDSDEEVFPKLSLEGEESTTVNVLSTKMEPVDHLQTAVKLSFIKYSESYKTFFKQLVDPTSRVAADVYSVMFFCDFFNFFVILFGYSSFGTQQGDGGVTSYLEDNRVPALFLVMLILQFMLIIIDRGIYLRKHILAKIVFQITQLVTLHIWLFIIYPLITERSFNSVLAPQMYYMVKCFYLLLSAYQIRCGYPTRILGNFLCKGYNYVNMFLFKGFMLLPFLFELRTVMDWMWTDTSMTVTDWIKMEDIFAHIFSLKCTRHCETEFPQARGEKKNTIVKYLMGGIILIIIIGIIWFPLVFFSLGNAVGEPNVPYEVSLEVRIGPYEPVYSMAAQSNSIYKFADGDLKNFLNVFTKNKVAATFISNYEAADIAAVKLSKNSANIWSISPPDRERMLAEINSTDPLSVRLQYKVSHKTSKPEDSGVIPDTIEIEIPALVNNQTNPIRTNLIEMLITDKSNSTVLFSSILPKFLKVTNRGTAKPVSQLMDHYYAGDSADLMRNISMNLVKKTEAEWWTMTEMCDDENYKKVLSKIPYSNCENIILYTFNDKIFPSTLNFVTGGGIIGLYTTLVFVASRLLRGQFSDQCAKIMFEDMPMIDRVLQLCLDIYLVRESHEFMLEEDLFAKLVFLFRSPETLIKWTRPIEEVDEDEVED